MTNRIKIIICLITAFLFCSPPPQNTGVPAKPVERIFAATLTALYVPIDTISLALVQQKDLAALKKANPVYLLFKKKERFSAPAPKYDSMYIENTNVLAQYELSLRCRVQLYKPDTNDSVQNSAALLLLRDFQRASIRDSGSLIAKIAEKNKVDLVVIPGMCSLGETETRPKTWRDNKYGTYYDKPSKVSAKAQFQVRVYDRNGTLLLERTGFGRCDRPVMYEALKQNRPQDQNLADYSKNVFAPTALRALGEACREAFAGQ